LGFLGRKIGATKWCFWRYSLGDTNNSIKNYELGGDPKKTARINPAVLIGFIYTTVTFEA
jgi:hypothetical protein